MNRPTSGPSAAIASKNLCHFASHRAVAQYHSLLGKLGRGEKAVAEPEVGSRQTLYCGHDGFGPSGDDQIAALDHFPRNLDHTLPQDLCSAPDGSDALLSKRPLVLGVVALLCDSVATTGDSEIVLRVRLGRPRGGTHLVECGRVQMALLGIQAVNGHSPPKRASAATATVRGPRSTPQIASAPDPPPSSNTSNRRTSAADRGCLSRRDLWLSCSEIRVGGTWTLRIPLTRTVRTLCHARTA